MEHAVDPGRKGEHKEDYSEVTSEADSRRVGDLVDPFSNSRLGYLWCSEVLLPSRIIANQKENCLSA